MNVDFKLELRKVSFESSGLCPDPYLLALSSGLCPDPYFFDFKVELRKVSF